MGRASPASFEPTRAPTRIPRSPTQELVFAQARFLGAGFGWNHARCGACRFLTGDNEDLLLFRVCMLAWGYGELSTDEARARCPFFSTELELFNIFLNCHSAHQWHHSQALALEAVQERWPSALLRAHRDSFECVFWEESALHDVWGPDLAVVPLKIIHAELCKLGKAKEQEAYAKIRGALGLLGLEMVRRNYFEGGYYASIYVHALLQCCVVDAEPRQLDAGKVERLDRALANTVAFRHELARRAERQRRVGAPSRGPVP